MTSSQSAPTSFAALGVPSVLAEQLRRDGLIVPFPIQTATLPDSLAGTDILGRGRTGSGKTLAFALPLVARLAGLVPKAAGGVRRAGSPRGLVLAPTRELANQILATIEPLASAAGLRVMTIFGGVSAAGQVSRLRQGVDIAVATPGRVEDLISQGQLWLDRVEITVLDEADHLADLGFLPSVTRILAATPAGGQRLLFSATLDNGVDRLVRRFMSRPSTHSVDPDTSAVTAMVHHVFLVSDPAHKRAVVHELAGGRAKRLLFTRTKHQARKLARELTGAGIPAVELHGNLSQNARERSLRAFAEGQVKVMVATDIAARGIHVDGVEVVVHVDPPAEHKAYLHRSGRTARAGNDGDVVTLVLPDQRRDFQALAKAARITAAPTPVTTGDPAISELVGETAVKVTGDQAPAAAARRAATPATPARPRGGKGQGNSARNRAGAGAPSPARSRSAESAGGRSPQVVQLSEQGVGRPGRRHPQSQGRRAS